MQTLTKRERWLISIIFIIIFIVGLIYTYSHRSQETPVAVADQQKHELATKQSKTNEAEQTTTVNNFIKIDVKGAVNHPGVYSLPANSRITDAINAAGGLSSQADTSNVNLASILMDGSQVVVPAQSPQTNWAAVHSSEQTGKINLNTATEEELNKLPGVGPTRAKQIVTYREQHGLFQSADDLLAIDGFGPKLLQKIKGQITIY